MKNALTATVYETKEKLALQKQPQLNPKGRWVLRLHNIIVHIVSESYVETDFILYCNRITQLVYENNHIKFAQTPLYFGAFAKQQGRHNRYYSHNLDTAPPFLLDSLTFPIEFRFVAQFPFPESTQYGVHFTLERVE